MLASSNCSAYLTAQLLTLSHTVVSQLSTCKKKKKKNSLKSMFKKMKLKNRFFMAKDKQKYFRIKIQIVGCHNSCMKEFKLNEVRIQYSLCFCNKRGSKVRSLVVNSRIQTCHAVD